MQTDQPPNSNNEYSTPAQFRSKLGSYLTGIVIGFTLLGMIYFMKHLATQSQQSPNAQQPVPTEMEATP
ncbi:MAG: hypothetical protein JKX70_06800 [Phycisphaerales bacterium]|nr:hypothetical protein [Phycisphaerales bacterium]